MTTSREHPLRILLVEDDRADAELTRQALLRTDYTHELRVAHSSEEAVAALAECAAANQALPDVVLLDLNMPGIDGLAFLSETREHPNIRVRSLPVVILTTSTNQADVDACYQAGANAYLSKPMGFTERVTLLRRTCEFWGDFAWLAHRSSTQPSPH